ncbi:MAG: hypothetical protein GY821_10055 [Gammaproteobacteria bacterium]|nr:hypothetical protein [Gammaproteobacteria bacterium]
MFEICSQVMADKVDPTGEESQKFASDSQSEVIAMGLSKVLAEVRRVAYATESIAETEKARLNKLENVEKLLEQNVACSAELIASNKRVLEATNQQVSGKGGNTSKQETSLRRRFGKSKTPLEPVSKRKRPSKSVSKTKKPLEPASKRTKLVQPKISGVLTWTEASILYNIFAQYLGVGNLIYLGPIRGLPKGM